MLFLVLCLFLAAEIAPTRPEVSYSQPQVASDGKTTGIVFGAGNTIYFAQPGATPVRVAETPNLALGNHRGPRVAYTEGAIVVTAGVGPEDQKFAPATLRSWRSTDHGATWTPGPALSTPGTGGMGFHGIGSDGRRNLWAAWIGPDQGHPTLFVSHSGDAGASWTKQRVLSATVCECCHPTVVVSGGTVRVLFRNSLNGNRDFYLAASNDGETFQMTKLGKESWEINACPMDGGGMSEFNGQIVTLWRRKEQIFLARPDGGAEEPFAAGHNPAVTLREKGLYAVWSSGQAIMAKAPGKEAWILSKSGEYPVIAPSGPVIVAWEDGGKIHTERID